jgi:hypothetical protein
MLQFRISNKYKVYIFYLYYLIYFSSEFDWTFRNGFITRSFIRSNQIWLFISSHFKNCYMVCNITHRSKRTWPQKPNRRNKTRNPCFNNKPKTATMNQSTM